MTLSIPVVKVLRGVPVAISSTTRDAPIVPASDRPPPKIATQRSFTTVDAGSRILSLDLPDERLGPCLPDCSSDPNTPKALWGNSDVSSGSVTSSAK